MCKKIPVVYICWRDQNLFELKFREMSTFRTTTIGIVTFAVLFYFVILPGLEAVQTMVISYIFKLLHKLKFVGAVLVGTTTLYFTQAALKRVDWENIKNKLPSLRSKRSAIKDKAGKDDDDEKSGSSTYPLQKVFLVASEMLSTEESYMNELRIIEEMFHVRVENENLVTPDVLKKMFANIRTIYQFHQQGLLPSLQERMTAWKNQKDNFSAEIDKENECPDQKIGDIFVKNAPYLRMYSEYIENFDNAMNTIDKQRKKNKKFAAMMEEIQASPELHRLSLQHHMLSPVQRIPRYKLLLEDYIKRLPENSSDLENAKKALELVDNAAHHSNDTMKRIEQRRKVLEVQALLGNTVELSSPTREFIKEGRVSKISTKTGDTLKDTLKDLDRYLFLFNDVLFVCSWNSLTKRVRGGSKYKVKMQFEFDRLVINESIEGDDTDKAFSVSQSKSTIKMDLLARTTEEKEEWVHSITKALNSFNERKKESKVSGLQEQDSNESKISLEEMLGNPHFLLNGNEYDNDSDVPSIDTHEDDKAENADQEDENSESDTSESNVTLRKRSPKSRYSVKSMSMGRSRSPAKRIKKKNSTLF